MSFYCSECRKDITESEYNYSIGKYKRALCQAHQLSANGNAGLNRVQKAYREQMIKGRIAETLIEELFLTLGYNVYRYGMENTVPGVMELLKGIRTDVAENIKRMPDFVVQDTKTGEVFFVEVKFRGDEKFSRSDIPKDYPYKNCYFIIVSKKHIKCISFDELEHKETITPTSTNYLGNTTEFNLNKEVIIDFCNFAIKFFSEV